MQVLRIQVSYKCMETNNLHVNYLEMDLSCLIRNAEISRGNVEVATRNLQNHLHSVENWTKVETGIYTLPSLLTRNQRLRLNS